MFMSPQTPSPHRPNPSDTAMPLTPNQQAALERLERMLPVAPLITLAATVGAGATRVLQELAVRNDGLCVSLPDIFAYVRRQPAKEADSAIGTYLLKKLGETDLLILDDRQRLQLSTLTTRDGYVEIVVMNHLRREAERLGKTLVVTGWMWSRFSTPASIYGPHTAAVKIDAVTPADYAAFVRNYLGDTADGIDFPVLFRFASGLNFHELRRLCDIILQADMPNPTTDQVIELMYEHGISADNTRTEHVEAVSLDALPGHEAIVKRLMTNIVLPLEHHELAASLGLKPKRGVLLYGPAGTGKTSIGRALAHRMKGKFFMIDGTFISEPPNQFFAQVDHIVEEAKRHSPSVLFIDDADVLFQLDHIGGLSRYLLSLLDGLESETSSNVCVMMTAMNVAHIPAAMLRSGRVELWLETKVPDEGSREQIIRHWLSDHLPGAADVDLARLSEASAGLTPADLRRLAGDAKSLYAADMVRQREPRTAEAYMLAAIANLRALRTQMADALADESYRVVVTVRETVYGAGNGGPASAASGW